MNIRSTKLRDKLYSEPFHDHVLRDEIARYETLAEVPAEKIIERSGIAFHPTFFKQRIEVATG